MAKPRIFISSTYYDLKHVRADLERFVRDMGYEPVLNERGNIPYGHTEGLEEYCYREIEGCDILISIVGGRFGSQSAYGDSSISHVELKTAIEKDIPVYIFAEKNVRAEYGTYLLNKDNAATKYKHVDNTETFKFLEQIDALPKNNITFAFESSVEIISILREQWAGMFQRLLQEHGRVKEAKIIEGMKSTAATLDDLVKFITEERQKDQQDVMRAIIFLNHPAFMRIKELLGIKYRVAFKNLSELEALLEARQFERMPEWSDEDGNPEPDYEWLEKKQKYPKRYIRVKKFIFDETGDLREFLVSDWSDDWVSITLVHDNAAVDDEIPF